MAAVDSARSAVERLSRLSVGTKLIELLSSNSLPSLPVEAEREGLALFTSVEEATAALGICEVLLRLFQQVNCTGPLVTALRPSEQTLERRRKEAAELFSDESLSTANVEEPAASFWRQAPYGHPDDRVGESQSDVVDDTKLSHIADRLSVDGETLSDSVRGVGYLYVPLYLSGLLHSFFAWSSEAYLVRLTLFRGRCAFAWQRCLSGSPHVLLVSPVLTRLSVGRVLACVEAGGLVERPLALFPPAPAEIIAERVGSSEAILERVAGSSPGEEEPNSLDTHIRLGAPPEHLCLKFFSELDEEARAAILVELAVRLTAIGKADQSVVVLKRASSVARFTFGFGSAFGFRRQHQSVPFPQLVVRVTENAPTKAPEEHVSSYATEPALPSGKECNSATVACGDKPRGHVMVDLKELDPLTDILETPKYLDDLEPSMREPLTETQLGVLLGHCHATLVSSPSREPLSLEQLRAIVERCMVSGTPESKCRANWMLRSACLFFRCKSEMHRSKTFERAVMQLQALSDQFWDKIPDASERLELVDQIYYPFRFELAWDLGRVLRDAGSLLSAFELFKELWMWEEAIECLIACGRKNIALDLLEERLAVRTSPRLLCCKGDIEDNPECYEAAWAASNGSYARAQRALGKYWLRKGNAERAAEALEKAARLNPMFVDVWFSLGACQMRLSQLELALQSFSRVVSLSNDSTGPAWSNMAAVHSQLERWDAAMVCASEGVKAQREDSRMWENYLHIAMKLGKVPEVILGMRNLLTLNKSQSLRPYMFSFLSEAAILDAVDKEKADSMLVKTVRHFFEEAIEFSLPECWKVFDCFARLCAAADDDRNLEYELRWKQFRSVVAQLPPAFDDDTAKSYASDLSRALHSIRLSHRRWSSEADPKAVEYAKLAEFSTVKAAEMTKLFVNVAERLERIGAKEHTNLISQLQDAAESL